MFRSVVIVSVVTAVVLAGGIAVALATPDTCKLECQQQFQEDKRACRDSADKSDESAGSDLQACIQAAESPRDARSCMTGHRSRARSDNRAKRLCDREAKESRDACRAACAESPVEP